MYCPNCENLIVDNNAERCPECGRSLKDATQRNFFINTATPEEYATYRAFAAQAATVLDNNSVVVKNKTNSKCVPMSTVTRCGSCGARVKNSIGRCEYCGAPLMGKTYTTQEPNEHTMDHGCHAKDNNPIAHNDAEMNADPVKKVTVKGVFIIIVFIIIAIALIALEFVGF